ncbi:NLR family CARD domain-containing protein 4-like [Branchiostoma lanceolatum]|uniref:NLR family CARD domain-containing protein 4-like n=1 Tax=Branchiostoma lanceolatum TaxID=7740 RepID=UPI003451E8A3
MGQGQSKSKLQDRSGKPRQRWSLRRRSRHQRTAGPEAGSSQSAPTAGHGAVGGSEITVENPELLQQTQKPQNETREEEVHEGEPQVVMALQSRDDESPGDDPNDIVTEVVTDETAVLPIRQEDTSIMAYRTQQEGSNNRTYNIGPQSTVHIYEGSSSVEERDGLNTSSFPLEECQNALKLHYEQEMGQLHPLAWNQDFMMKTDDIFTDVDLLLQSPQGGKVNRKPLPSEALASRSDCPCPRRVLIEGQPGIGKTTTLFKLVVDWSTGDNKALSEFDLVFCVALRKVAESQSLVDCIFDQLLPEDATFDETDLEEYLKTNKNVLVILDGYDEWEPMESHDISKVLCGKILRDCCVIVSTRPSRTSDLLKMMRPDTRLEINGFHPDNVSTYVHKYFGDNVPKAKRLLEKPESNFLSTGITLTPMFLLLICLLWEERDDLLLSDRLCPLYDQLILYLVTRFCVRENIPFVDEKLPPNINTAVLFVEKLAFDGLMRGKLIFEEDEVSQGSKDVLVALVNLGLLHKQPSPSKLRPSPQYSFSHKTMQEYFAGRYIASYITGQNESMGRTLLEESFGTVRKVREMDNVLIFACGKLGRKGSVIFQYLADLHQKDLEPLEDDFYTFYDRGIIIKDWRKNTKLDSLASREDYLIFEMKSLFTDTPGVLFVYQTYLETALLCYYEWGYIDGFIEHFMRRKVIQFSGSTPRLCSALAQLMKCKPFCGVQHDVPSCVTKAQCNVSKSDYGSSQETGIVIRLVHTRRFCLGPILDTLGACSSIVELNLRQSCLGMYGPTLTMPSLQLSRQLPNLKLLRKLVLSWNDMQPEDVRLILPSLESLKVLEELYLSGNSLYGTGDILCNILPFLSELKIVRVFDCFMTAKELRQIGRSLVKYCKDIREFDFDENHVDLQETQEILKILNF